MSGLANDDTAKRSVETAGLTAEARRVMDASDARARELSLVLERARNLRDECHEIEAEAEALLRRLLLAADAAGAADLRAAVRRELAAIAQEM